MPPPSVTSTPRSNYSSPPPALFLTPPPPPPSPAQFATFHPLPIRRAPSQTPTLDHYTTDPSLGYIPQNRKRNGSYSYSTKAKFPRNTSNIKCHVYTARHSITGFKHNIEMFQNPNNSLDSILGQIQNRMCDSRECRLVIFVVDFLLDFTSSVEATIDKIDQIYQFVESHGHMIMFAFLPYVPAISKDPKTKIPTLPSPNHTDYLVTLNNRLQVLASANPIKQAFSNKVVGYNHDKDNYKPSSWQGYNSTAPPHLRFSCCFSYTLRELTTRSTHFFNHVEKFITSLK